MMFKYNRESFLPTDQRQELNEISDEENPEFISNIENVTGYFPAGTYKLKLSATEPDSPYNEIASDEKEIEFTVILCDDFENILCPAVSSFRYNVTDDHEFDTAKLKDFTWFRLFEDMFSDNISKFSFSGSKVKIEPVLQNWDAYKVNNPIWPPTSITVSSVLISKFFLLYSPINQTCVNAIKSVEFFLILIFKPDLVSRIGNLLVVSL